MAASCVKFKEKAFWSDDAWLEGWLYFFVQELSKLKRSDIWIKQIEGDWYLQAKLGFMGCINLGLDEVIDSQEKKEILEAIALKVNNKFLVFGKVLPNHILTELETIGHNWPSPPKTSNFIKVGQLFIELINERLQWTVSSSLEYKRPENWETLLP